MRATATAAEPLTLGGYAPPRDVRMPGSFSLVASTLYPQADIVERDRHVCFVPKADVAMRISYIDWQISCAFKLISAHGSERKPRIPKLSANIAK